MPQNQPSPVAAEDLKKKIAEKEKGDKRLGTPIVNEKKKAATDVNDMIHACDTGRRSVYCMRVETPRKDFPPFS
jgi:hypothetical protein